MKKQIYTIVVLVVILFSCSSQKQERDSSLFVFDTEETYPPKDIDIHSIADIHYVIPEAKDSFLYTSLVYATENHIICFNFFGMEYTFFDKNGNPISIIDKKGQGPDEYLPFWIQLYDEENDNFFVYSYPNKIKVYNKYGEFKKALNLPENSLIDGMYNYNDQYLICHDKQENTSRAFYLLDKKDGTVQTLSIPYDKKITQSLRRKMDYGETLNVELDASYVTKGSDYTLLTEYSSDTIFKLSGTDRLIPVSVRTPSVQVQNPPVVLHGFIDTPQYLFFSTQKKEYDFKTREGMEHINYMYDKEKAQIYRIKAFNSDYEDQNLVLSPALLHAGKTPYSNLGILSLNAESLHKALEKDRLHGELKKIVETMKEDDPFVVMVLNFKKDIQ